MPTARAIEPIRNLEDFLAWEERQPERYEYLDGAVVAMVGGTLAHNIIVGNLGAALRPRFRGSNCRVFTENVRLVVQGNSLYPDVLVSCGFDSPRQTQVEDALLVAEVLSPASEKTDRERKMRLYTGMAGLRHYLLISQDAQFVQIYSQTNGQWLFALASHEDAVIDLPGIDARVTLADLYEGAGAVPLDNIAANSPK